MDQSEKNLPIIIPTIDIESQSVKNKFTINSYTLAGIITFVIITGVLGGIFYISSTSGTGNSSDQIPESIRSINTFKNNVLGATTKNKVTPTAKVSTPTPTKLPVQIPTTSPSKFPDPTPIPTSNSQPTSTTAPTSSPTSAPTPTSTPTPTNTPSPTPTPSE